MTCQVLNVNTIRKKHTRRCGSPVGRLQAVEPVVTVAIQASLRCPVGHRSREETQEEPLEPVEDDQVHGDSTSEHPADHPGPLTSAEEGLRASDRQECTNVRAASRLRPRHKTSSILPTFAACLLISDAISPPELPMPTTITLFPVKVLPSL